jgi:hypothetical protein
MKNGMSYRLGWSEWHGLLSSYSNFQLKLRRYRKVEAKINRMNGTEGKQLTMSEGGG